MRDESAGPDGRNLASALYPNGNDADAPINVASHEHNEVVTDEGGNAWPDRAGNENGDKCAWDLMSHH